jgi:serine/threonine protein kinase
MIKDEPLNTFFSSQKQS